mmetsp:Transcript_1273/g.2303  ORF Transcript_1273/g.2303 Transcript_1273/m.2303 type:complete len:392 (+) Transcript_1273:96-1271(+)
MYPIAVGVHFSFIDRELQMKFFAPKGLAAASGGGKDATNDPSLDAAATTWTQVTRKKSRNNPMDKKKKRKNKNSGNASMAVSLASTATDAKARASVVTKAQQQQQSTIPVLDDLEKLRTALYNVLLLCADPNDDDLENGDSEKTLAMIQAIVRNCEFQTQQGKRISSAYTMHGVMNEALRTLKTSVLIRVDCSRVCLVGTPWNNKPAQVHDDNWWFQQSQKMITMMVFDDNCHMDETKEESKTDSDDDHCQGDLSEWDKFVSSLEQAVVVQSKALTEQELFPYHHLFKEVPEDDKARNLCGSTLQCSCPFDGFLPSLVCPACRKFSANNLALFPTATSSSTAAASMSEHSVSKFMLPRFDDNSSCNNDILVNDEEWVWGTLATFEYVFRNP